MKSRYALALIAAVFLGQTGSSFAQEKKTVKPKTAPAKTPPAKVPGKPASKYDQHLAAQTKLLNVLSRYADALSGATDAGTAALALNQLEAITKDAIIAGEEVVKIGRPTPEIQTKLAKDPDLEVTSRRVAEQTRSAVKALASNTEVKTILAPAIENFQSALNRIQQDIDDPKGPGPSPKAQAAAGKPSPAPPAGETPASKASSVPAPR